MGTVPNNFPPDASMEIGQLLTGSALNLTATLPPTVFFTAPTRGLYLVSVALHVVATNNAGTLVATVVTPNAGNVLENTPVLLTPAAAVVKDLLPSVPVDGYMAAIPLWFNQGQTVSVGAVAAGLTGTTYNVFVTAQRVF